ncbi:ABC transporter substrate-binding protein [Hydrogenophaga sp. Root209]|uniref:ABC transporter substrate-binding protein n=1 Tax=Hydrogenophaga sp. Root209 TaxID=1736490 RepID=UPI0009E7191E|nr:ABC transporter substrate-binding protein [Hydrogenophaga sp. Root209]
MKRRTAIAFALAMLVAGCAGLPAPVPATPEPLRVIVFPGGFNWPIWVAQQRGYFGQQGLAVQVTPTPNSTFQLKGLIQGDFDLAMTAIDNVIAYREGQGEAGIDGPDLVAVMGADNGFLRLVGAPDIASIADLRGKTLSVDALTTGYAFVLLEMLDRNGLKLDRDYRTERAGGVSQRYQALLQRKHAGTMLITPFDVNAAEQGFKTLGRANEVLGEYQGLVAAVRQGWARENPRRVSAYIRAFTDSVEWLYDPKNKDEAIRIYLANMPQGTSAQSAEVAYRVLLDAKDGFYRQGRLNMQGVEKVVQLRAKFGPQGKTLRPAAAYVDNSFLNAAMKRR